MSERGYNCRTRQGPKGGREGGKKALVVEVRAAGGSEHPGQLHRKDRLTTGTLLLMWGG